ncbi:MAG: sodium:proton exchanger [Bacteroidetes bacterium]|nr:MAG: sodium:proton exchanger [Bacteroidota bacterium]
MEFGILRDIVVIFTLSTVVNLVFTRIKVPTIVGYLLTGILAGPHVFALTGDQHDLELLAEIGVILLLFTIGLEFSLRHLLKIRRIVFFGGLIQVSVTAGVFFLLSRVQQLDWQAGLFVGFLAALSSSAIVLKLLQERSELTSNYGRTVLGILIFQDLMLIPLLLLANVLGGEGGDLPEELLDFGLKVVLIFGFVYAGNKWILPRLLHLIAMTKNQELFMMSILLICLAVALLTSQLGMSLAIGAFLAGLMISESEYSHNAFANLVPFKDIFASFFFVSIGMLLDLGFLREHIQLVILIVLLVIVLKMLIAGGTGFILGHTLRGTIMVGLALSQVGEFSFVLAKIGSDLDIIPEYHYHLFLAVAVISMGLTPFLMKASLPLADLLLRLPLPVYIVEGLFPLKEMDIPEMQNHLVIIGKDNSALKLSKMASLYDIRHVSIIFDPLIARERITQGETVVYGDAVNEPILLKARVENADIVVVSVGSLIPSMAIVEKVRKLNKSAHILVRATQTQNVAQLYSQGADQVIPEKLEIAIDLFNRVLVQKLFTQRDVNRIIASIRNVHLGEFTRKDRLFKPSILDEFPNVSISALEVESGSEAENLTLLDSRLRNRTGVTLLAIRRGDSIIEHPEPSAKFLGKDIVYVLGNPEQINLASELFSVQAGTDQ